MSSQSSTENAKTKQVDDAQSRLKNTWGDMCKIEEDLLSSFCFVGQKKAIHLDDSMTMRIRTLKEIV